MNDKEKLNKKIFTEEQILEIKNICDDQGDELNERK